MPGGLRESLGYLRWIYDPTRRPSVTDIYELLATNAFSRRGLYLNLGYWRTAEDIDAACAALVDLLGRAAALGPGERVVDVGFGFGDQDLRWLRTRAPASIVGLNVTASQVREARRRVAEAGLSDRIAPLQASATAMPLPDAAHDKVLALECAFHFDTRVRFLAEARRVLRPGGRLAVGDIVRAPPAPSARGRAWQDWSWRMFRRTWDIPRANSHTRVTYVKALIDAGFDNVRVESIRGDVFAPLHRHLAAHPELTRRFHPLARGPLELALRADPDWLYAALDYVLVTADVPREPRG